MLEALKVPADCVNEEEAPESVVVLTPAYIVPPVIEYPLEIERLYVCSKKVPAA